MSKRLNLMVDDDAFDKLLAMADSPNKRGKKVSELIRAAYDAESVQGSVDLESIRLQLAGLAGSVRQIDGRLMKVETTLAALISRIA